MSFTDQKPRIATEADLHAPWGGVARGKRFKCYLCGHPFAVGDIWRWVHSSAYGNFLVCKACDGEDAVQRWLAANQELETRFWWACT